MSGARPTLRHGLPYRWWRRQEFWASFIAVLCLLAALLVGLALLYGWFLG